MCHKCCYLHMQMFWKNENLTGFGRVTLPECHPTLLPFACGPSLNPSCDLASFLFCVLIQQSHRRVWMGDCTSWPLCLSVGGRRPHTAGSEPGSGCVSETPVTQPFLTAARGGKPVPILLACPPPQLICKAARVRQPQKKMADNRVFTVWV